MENNTNNNETSPRPLSTSGLGRISWVKNKYLIAGILFLVWMFFFDVKDISSSIGRWRKYGELQASEQQLTKKIGETRLELGQLKNNAQTIERYAREKYLMKKDNEDLFIVNEAKKEK